MKDIFHVTQHYGATFCKPHPLREAALAELSEVFFGGHGARTKETRIPEPAVLFGRLQSWYDKFEKVLPCFFFHSLPCKLMAWRFQASKTAELTGVGALFTAETAKCHTSQLAHAQKGCFSDAPGIPTTISNPSGSRTRIVRGDSALEAFHKRLRQHFDDTQVGAENAHYTMAQFVQETNVRCCHPVSSVAR